MTDPVEVPTAQDTPLYSERVTLDGRDFILTFDWNDREKRWYLSIADIAGNALALGLKIVANWDLLRRFTDPRLPQGTLMALDLSNQRGEPPGFAELGVRVKLFFQARS